MSSAISGTSSNAKIGTCPHGMPLGACPICSGMGGGSVKRDNKPKEMSWNECYAIGQMLKAQKNARKQTLQMYASQDLQAYLNRLQEQINILKTTALNNLPQPIAKTVVILANVILMPTVKALSAVLNTAKNIVSVLSKTLDNIKQKLTDISDKLTAIFGEAKASIEKKISEKFKDMKKKIFNIFGITTADNEEDEELSEIEEKKKIYELNTAKETVLEKKTLREEEMEAGETE